MKFSTRLAHSRVRFKHKLVKLRIQKPAYYQALSALMLIFAVAGMVVAYIFIVHQKSSEAAPVLQIKSYSFNGTITEMSGNFITIRAGSLKTENGKNEVVYSYQNIEVNAQTQIVLVTINNGKIETAPGSLNNLQVGQAVAVYSSTNPVGSSVLSVNKLEVILQQ